MAVINETILKKATAGSHELLVEIAEKFAQTLPLLRDGLNFGIENRCPKLIESSARQIKNHVRYYGAESLEQLAADLVANANSDDPGSLQPLRTELEAGIETLLVELREMTKLALPVG